MIWVSVNFDFFIQPPGGEKMPESSTYWVSTDRGSLRRLPIGALGAAARRWNGRPWVGSTGITIADCWGRSATYPRQKPRRRTTPATRVTPWRRDSNEMASGEAGAIQEVAHGGFSLPGRITLTRLLHCPFSAATQFDVVRSRSPGRKFASRHTVQDCW